MQMTLLADPPTGFDDGTATPTFGLSAPFLAAAFSMLPVVGVGVEAGFRMDAARADSASLPTTLCSRRFTCDL